MSDIDQLIGSLSTDLKPKKSFGPLNLFAKWMAGSAVWLGLMIAVFGTRPDLTAKLQSPLFLTELLTLAAIVICTAIAVTYISYPDIRQKPRIILLPVIPGIAFIITMYFALKYDAPYYPPTLEPGYMCLLCISVISSVPSLIIFVILRKQATTHPYIAGMLAMFASSALGNLTFRLSERRDDISHLITWHYIPILGFSFIGLLLGKKILKW